LSTRNDKTCYNRSERAPIHPVSLSFKSEKLQRDYSKYHVQRSLKLVRISLVLGMVLYMSYSFLDKIIMPQTATPILLMRVTISLFFLMIFGISYTKMIYKGYQFIMSFMVLLAGLGIVWMIWISDVVGGIYYYAGLILVIIYAHGISRLRFIYASMMTWVIVIVYEINTFSLGITPFIIGMNNTFFLVSSNLLGMFSSYALEYYMRTVFWQNQVLRGKSQQLEAEHQRKSQELEAVRQIQLAMLPQRVPQHPALELCVSMKTATEIGGDYYDFHQAEDGTLTFVFGDATGHGAQAGAMVTATKFIFTSYAGDQDIVDFLVKASQALKQMKLPRLFMALAIGRFSGHTLEVAGSGLPPALLFRSTPGTIEEIPLKGIPLGGYGSISYQKKIIELSGGDSLLFMTDGFAELTNKNGFELGYDKAKEILAKVARRSTNDIIKKFNFTAKKWMDGQPQQDDMTFLAIKMKESVRTVPSWTADCIIHE
jgi:hypothetical protein